jgi:hypothetical protein
MFDFDQEAMTPFKRILRFTLQFHWLKLTFTSKINSIKVKNHLKT